MATAEQAAQLLADLSAFARTDYRPLDGEPARAILAADPEVRAEIAVQLLELVGRQAGWKDQLYQAVSSAAKRVTLTERHMFERLVVQRLIWTEPQAVRALAALVPAHKKAIGLDAPMTAIARTIKQTSLTPALRTALELLGRAVSSDGFHADERRALQKIGKLLAHEVDSTTLPIAGSPWGTLVTAAISAQPPERQAAWRRLCLHAMDAEGKSQPSARWVTQAAELTAPLPDFGNLLGGWLDEAKLGHAGLTERDHALLKGFLWAAGTVGDPLLAAAIGAFAERCYRKVAGHGAADVRLGNACLFALGAMPHQGIAHLSRLAGKIRYALGKRLIEKALAGAAERLGQTREDLEELAVPTGDLDERGTKRIPIGDYQAELTISNGVSVSLAWIRPDGKPQAAVPAALKSEHAVALRAVKKEGAALQALLDAQATRLEGMWLSGRTLPVAALRERYLAHPLVGQVGRRLLWRVEAANGPAEAIWHDRQLRDLAGRAMPDDVPARLWHPLDGMRDGIDGYTIWRDLFEQRALRQPFAQLTREIYRPVIAEADTDQRFAGHLVHQQALLAQCKQRGWTYTIQGHWDSHNNPGLYLPRHELYVELEAEPVEHKRDSHVYTYLAIGEVRLERRPEDGSQRSFPAGTIPPLVFSEVIRAIELMIMSSSVAHDGTFDEDGLTEPWRAWWREAVFGELNPVARTRRELLAQIVARSSLAARARCEDRWLVVDSARGPARIHIGTAQVRLGGGDEPVAVKPDATARERAASVALPFTGDTILSTILAKAFQLAM